MYNLSYLSLALFSLVDLFLHAYEFYRYTFPTLPSVLLHPDTSYFTVGEVIYLFSRQFRFISRHCGRFVKHS